jgi:diacylglycerol kinase
LGSGWDSQASSAPFSSARCSWCSIELVNSAVEATVDRIGVERHPLSAIAKELGSAAVFVAFVLLALNWILVLAWRH